jgi:hypothetical protein
MSNIVKLGRIFRERLEFDHRPVGSSEHWVFTFQHVSEHGRRVVGNYGDVASAFAVACEYRNRGVRVVAVERGQR